MEMKKEFNLTPVSHRDPIEGEYLIIFTCLAELVDSPIKRNVVDLLKKDKENVHQAILLLKDEAGCTEQEALKLTYRICKDLIDKKNEQEILDCPHEFIARVLYYGNPRDVPVEDKRWSIHPLNFAKSTK